MTEDEKVIVTEGLDQCQAETCKEDLMNGLLAILAEEEEKASEK